MKAILLEKAGGIENLIIKNVEQPAAKENEVLVEVKAISVNPVDYKVRSIAEVLSMFFGEERPVILGWDVSGTVVSVGKEVTKFKAGDDVFGMVNFPGQGNAYAELVAAPEDQLALKPANVSFEEAAATTLAALTALQVLNTRVKKDDRVLIHAGAGGVGHFAIQIAKNFGAYVVTTSSAKNRDFVISLGADEHIDYRAQNFEEVVSDMDFVLDGMGGDILLKSLEVVREGGTVLSLPTGQFPEAVTKRAEELKVKAEFLLVQSKGEDMNTLKHMLEKGTLKAHVSASFPFAEMGQAHLALESGRTVGKVVVTV